MSFFPDLPDGVDVPSALLEPTNEENLEVFRAFPGEIELSDRTLGRGEFLGEQIVVWLERARVLPSSVLIAIQVNLRNKARIHFAHSWWPFAMCARTEASNDFPPDHDCVPGAPEQVMRLGFETADGKAWLGWGGDDPTEPRDHGGGSVGQHQLLVARRYTTSGSHRSMQFMLQPMEFRGSLHVHFAWEALGIKEAALEIPEETLNVARERVEPFWT